MATKYILHIQNPFNMGEFDLVESNEPWGAFSVGDVLQPMTFRLGVDDGKIDQSQLVKIVQVRHLIGKVGDSLYHETWLVTDSEWMEHH